MLTSSRYNFAFPVKEGVLLYSASTGAVLLLTGSDSDTLAHRLAGVPGPVDPCLLSPGLARDLLEGGMIVPAGTDELAPIKARYWRARADTPMALTITTTMDCNLGCYYCYEERSTASLAYGDIPRIVSLAETRLRESGKRSLHVDWYGGEPLLNPDFLAQASVALQSLCRELGVGYSASIISNGTAWPEDVGAFVRDHAIRQVQISFDGMQGNHDKRRHYRAGRGPGQGASSFARALAVVDRLLDHVRVDVRFNMDRTNVSDVPAFLEMMRSRGWFDRPYPVVVQPARLAAYSERSSFMRKVELSAAEFEDKRAEIRLAVGGEVSIEESEVPDAYPFPRTSVCAALAQDSIVVGAEGDLYRCGLQAGERGRAVGNLTRAHGDARRQLPVLGSGGDENWWNRFDPTEQPRCARCSFLPICWSGCPKKHLEGDTHAIDEQGAYWRRNLARLVASGVGLALRAAQELEPADQFRD